MSFRKGTILAINKWDMIDGRETNTTRDYEASVRKKIATYSYLPMIFISAETGRRGVNVLKLCKKIEERQNIRIPTPELNRFLQETVNRQHPAAVRGKYIKFYYVTQTEVKPPTFVLFCNYPKLLQKQYMRYIENRLRERYDFEGVPVRIKVRAKEGKR
jgi:GTP-binding protein